MNRNGEAVTREEIDDDGVYQVTKGGHQIREMTGAELRRLPHWKYPHTARIWDDYQGDGTNQKYVEIRCNIQTTVQLGAPTNSGIFKWADAGQPTIALRQTRNELRQQLGVFEAQASMIEDTRRRIEAARQQYIGLFKPDYAERMSHFQIETIRERLMRDPAILDVIFPSEKINLTLMTDNTDHQREMVQPSGVMTVVFIGALMHSEDDRLSPVLPLPPMMIDFKARTDGSVKGGYLCIHPHIRPRDMCPGEARDMIAEASRDNDIYSAVDIMRVYRMGYNAQSPLNPNFRTQAWDWWLNRFANGWPTEEPFRKPWLGAGMPVQDNLTGRIMKLSAAIGSTDTHEIVTGLHLGMQAGWFERAFRQGLKQTGIFRMRGQLEAPTCSCGYIHPEDVLEAKARPQACACHSNQTNVLSMLPCPTCNEIARYCSCPWTTRDHWVKATMGYCYAYKRPEMVRCDRSSAGDMQIYTLRRPRASRAYYSGPKSVCEEHLPAGRVEGGRLSISNIGAAGEVPEQIHDTAVSSQGGCYLCGETLNQHNRCTGCGACNCRTCIDEFNAAEEENERAYNFDEDDDEDDDESEGRCANHGTVGACPLCERDTLAIMAQQRVGATTNGTVGQETIILHTTATTTGGTVTPRPTDDEVRG